MGCNCKNKKNMTSTDFTIEELEKAVNLIWGTIHKTPEEKDFLYELHNRIFIKNKQLNMNCGDCFKLVQRNLLNFYEKQK